MLCLLFFRMTGIGDFLSFSSFSYGALQPSSSREVMKFNLSFTCPRLASEDLVSWQNEIADF